MKRSFSTVDGNEAVATIAYKASEVIAIYPITPSSNMGEWADAWASAKKLNLWNTIPLVQEMQSEGGAAGAVHGALQAGCLATTFTASQGLLLMIPNMFKIAGELTPAVFHVAARSLAAHALSIFGDHSDVMAARQTGFALLSSASVQEAYDLALVCHSATLKARVPFVHFFDGFRTSHEIAKIEELADDEIRAMLDEPLVQAHRSRALTPDHPVLRGTAQNPDVYFQGREAVNSFYEACPGIVQETMNRLARITGRPYQLFDYVGSPDAERLIIIMGSGAETTQETVEALRAKGEKVGVLKVRLFRPFSISHFIAAIPSSVKSIAVLDRTKEPGSAGEPLYQDVLNAFMETVQEGKRKSAPHIIGGRYGLSSKEFTPAMVKAVFDELKKERPKNHFTVGITDDVTHTSLAVDPTFSTESPTRVRALFYGLGSDGTVSANKNSIKIIGSATENHVQGYFVYDSKKAGAMTVSHLRFGPDPIRSSYLVSEARFIGCHQFNFIDRYDMVDKLEVGGVFLLNSPFGPLEAWDALPRFVQETLIRKKAEFYVIDAYKVAKEAGMGGRINTIMQTCFFAISGILPREKAIEVIKKSIEKTYGNKGPEAVRLNFKAIDETLAHLYKVTIPGKLTSTRDRAPMVPPEAPVFTQNVLAPILAGHGDNLPVSSFPCDGTYPTGTAKFEKRNIATEIPVWDESVCIQCGKCVLVCPHAAIRAKIVSPSALAHAPVKFKSAPTKNREFDGKAFILQVAPEDCVGCTLCVEVCPAKNKSETKFKAINMKPQAELRIQEKENWNFFLGLPEIDRRAIKRSEVRATQFLEPLFEFSGACGGCGETPYIKLMSQLFGDRAVVANATGCSSIYGGNLPTTPWTKNKEGRGPAWSNSLFEDNAEFGLGLRLATSKQMEMAFELLKKLESSVGTELVQALHQNQQKDEAEIFHQRELIEQLRQKLKGVESPEAGRLRALLDGLVRKSVWILGGDGWAYDIGFGGLDHVLASGEDVNVLVLDTEVYSNTGGQMSKATPRAAVAKFATGGKSLPKKDLAQIAMTYGHVYVAQVAMGARDEHTIRAFLEAEAYRGPSLIIAYSHCIAHGGSMPQGMQEQKEAVQSGHWPLFRYNPELIQQGKNPFQLDSAAPQIPLQQFFGRQNRFQMLFKSHPERAKELLQMAQEDANRRFAFFKQMATAPGAAEKGGSA